MRPGGRSCCSPGPRCGFAPDGLASSSPARGLATWLSKATPAIVSVSLATVGESDSPHDFGTASNPGAVLSFTDR